MYLVISYTIGCLHLTDYVVRRDHASLIEIDFQENVKFWKKLDNADKSP